MKGFPRIHMNAPVVLGFAGLSFLMQLLSVLTGGRSTALLFCVYRSSPLDPLTYLRLFTHVLGHASWSHFYNNMLLFLLTGPMLEEKYGSKKLGLIIAITALVTGLAHILVSSGALLGASGVVFAFILLSSITDLREGTIPLTFLVVGALYLGGQIYSGITSSDNVSQMSHILGGLVGAFAGFFLQSGDRRSG